jgi:hypothetical protein
MGRAPCFQPAIGLLFLAIALAMPAKGAGARRRGAGARRRRIAFDVIAEELRIQREGYAAAIASPGSGPRHRAGSLHRRIAITLFEWANNTPCARDRRLDGHREPGRRRCGISEQLLLADRTAYGQRRTSISGAIAHACIRPVRRPRPIRPTGRVIDISGDGPNNQGLPVTEARDAGDRPWVLPSTDCR